MRGSRSRSGIPPSTGSTGAREPSTTGRITEIEDDDPRTRVEADRLPPIPVQPEVVGQSVPHRANEGQTSPTLSAVTEELDNLRQWLKEARDREELEELRQIRARYEAGDRTALQPTQGIERATAAPRFSSANLPKPEPPHTYSKKNRAQYNRWERDCEGFFLRSPDHFVTEAQRVEFGTRYISEPLKSLWRSYMESQTIQDPTFEPNWANVKQVMLDALGTPLERKQQAYEQLKRCHQSASQSPTDLLDYMRPLWEELGTTQSPDMQALEYFSALQEYIQKDLYLLPPDKRTTIAMIEEQANVIFRRRARTTPKAKEEKPKRQHQNNSGSEGDRKTPKTTQKAGELAPKTLKWPKRPETAGKSAAKGNITCYRCGKPGHYADRCRSPHPKNAEGSAGKDRNAEGSAGKVNGSKD